MGAPLPHLVSMRQAADLLGIGARKLWQMVNCGQLPAVRIGRRVLLDPADLRAWIEGSKTRGPAR